MFSWLYGWLSVALSSRVDRRGRQGCCCCCCWRAWLAQYWEISLRYVRQRIILRSRLDGRKSNTGQRARRSVTRQIYSSSTHTTDRPTELPRKLVLAAFHDTDILARKSRVSDVRMYRRVCSGESVLVSMSVSWNVGLILHYTVTNSNTRLQSAHKIRRCANQIYPWSPSLSAFCHDLLWLKPFYILDLVYSEIRSTKLEK